MADIQNVIYPVFSDEYPIYLTGIGISEPEYHVERQTGLASHQFLFTLDGEGELLCGGQCYPQKAGSCFIWNPAYRTGIIRSAQSGKPHGWCFAERGLRK